MSAGVRTKLQELRRGEEAQKRIAALKERTERHWRRKGEYAADFEATTAPPVLAYMFSISRVDKAKPSTLLKNKDGVIEEALKLMFSLSTNKKYPAQFYFHNLEYDFALIWSWLNLHCKNKERYSVEAFVLPATKNVVKAEITFEGDPVYDSDEEEWVRPKKKIILRDSYVLFVEPLASVMKGFTRGYEKTETPLFKTKEDIEFTEEFERYARVDALALGEALANRLVWGMGKMTLASGAKATWAKSMEMRFGKLNAQDMFPVVDIDEDRAMRSGYKGGYCYLNPEFKSKLIKERVDVFDINSMYPAQMLYKLMPYGLSIWGEGQCKPTKAFPCVIQKIRIASAVLRPHAVPHLSAGGATAFGSIKYEEVIDEDTAPHKREFVLIYDELIEILDSYDIEGLEYLEYWKYKGCYTIFEDYLSLFEEMKKSDNKARATVGKRFMNALYGKFGQNPISKKYELGFDEERRIEVKVPCDDEEIEGGYLPIAIFITAYSRLFLIQSIKKVGRDNFIYCDTDSLHVLASAKAAEKLEIDDKEFGKWKHEGVFDESLYHRTKRYCHHMIWNSKKGDCDILEYACAGIKKSDLEREIKKVEEFQLGRLIKSWRMRMGEGGYYSDETEIKI